MSSFVRLVSVEILNWKYYSHVSNFDVQVRFSFKVLA